MQDKSARVGIGFSIFGCFSALVMGLFPMTGWTIPPMWAQIGVIVSFVFMLVGLVLIFSALKKSSTKIKEQEITIKEQDDSLRILRQKYTRFDEISTIVDKMNKMLSDFVDTKIDETISRETMEYIFFSWIAKAGNYLLPISEKPSTFSWIACLILVSFQILSFIKANDRAITKMSWLNGEMDEKNVGLREITETDEYKKLLDDLTSIRNKIGNEMLNQSIDKYMLYSYTLNSFLLFYAYTREYRNRMPMLRIPITQIEYAFNVKMNALRTQIIKHVELSLIGR